MTEKTKNEYLRWINEKTLSPEEKNQLLQIENNDEAINDAFYQDLKFGTGGLRGVLGLGTNRLNKYTINKATQGLANYLNKHFKNSSVAISYDSRNFSKEYAFEAAKVLSSNGIKAYIYSVLKPTPVLSYTVRELHCQAGIMLTASHNPKQYNGYKAYGPDGCQATDKLAGEISDEIEKVDIFNDIKNSDDSLVSIIDEKVYESFLKSTLNKSLLDKNVSRDIKICYTPLNGTGRYPVQDILKLCGFNNVNVVKEQEEPDGNFTTCPYPNPEIHDALKLGINLLQETKSDILIATDPDCDRLGLVSLDSDGIHYYTGNEVGVLFFDYVYTSLKETGKLPKHPAVVKTIVSTDLINVMAEKLGAEVFEVLTGFKYIGEVIHNLDQDNRKDDYLLGFEESCGYLTNTDVRDKDAVNAAMLCAELVALLKSKNKTPASRLKEIYEEYGHFITDLVNYEFPGESGKNKINDIMSYFRTNDVDFGIGKITTINDYLLSTSRTNGIEKEIYLPKSNVLKYIFEDKTTLTLRPSGTEPKIKFYFCSKNKEHIDHLKVFLNDIVQNN